MFPKWTRGSAVEERNRVVALLKDGVIVGIGVCALVVWSRTLPTLPTTLTGLPLRSALAATQAVVLWADIGAQPAPSSGDHKFYAIQPIGHAAFFTVQTLMLQFVVFASGAAAAALGDARLGCASMCLSLWTATQGVILTLNFFKLNWFEAKWRTQVAMPQEAKYPGWKALMLFTHVPALPLALVDLLLVQDGATLARFGPSPWTLAKVAVAYAVAYTAWLKTMQHVLRPGTLVYPFVADLNTPAKVSIFVVAQTALVSVMIFGLAFLKSASPFYFAPDHFFLHHMSRCRIGCVSCAYEKPSASRMEYRSSSALAAIDAEIAALASVTSAAPFASARRREPLQPLHDASPPLLVATPSLSASPQLAGRNASSRSGSVAADADASRRKIDDILTSVGMGGTSTAAARASSPISSDPPSPTSSSRAVPSLPSPSTNLGSGRGRVFDETHSQQRQEIAELRKALLLATQQVHRASAETVAAKSEAAAAQREVADLRRALAAVRESVQQRDADVERERRNAEDARRRDAEDARRTGAEKLAREQQIRERAEERLRRTETERAAAVAAASKHEQRATSAEAIARQRGRALKELVQFVRGPLKRLVNDSAGVLRLYGVGGSMAESSAMHVAAFDGTRVSPSRGLYAAPASFLPRSPQASHVAPRSLADVELEDDDADIAATAAMLDLDDT